MSKVDSYLKRVATFEAPADRAITLHRAREIVHEAQSKLGGLYHPELKYRSETILAEEVEACRQAAVRAPTPDKKLKWIRRAMEEINLPSGKIDPTYCFLWNLEKTCRVAASLWEQAGEAFLMYANKAESHCYGLINPYSEVFCDRLYAAARCFRNSAYFRSPGTHSDVREKNVHDLTRAIHFQKKYRYFFLELRRSCKTSRRDCRYSNLFIEAI